ncbi:MAG TPA: ABC transporter permease [Cyclobacteriaceae bacterium]|nr:ABC transporter permease [Cyclobacteriaceae bacterium]
MIRNYLVLAYRNIIKSKFFSLINILGLSLGMAACLLIIQYVMHEYSYDNFYDKKDRIYRIQQDRFDKGKLSTQWADGCSAVGQAMKENLPEVEEYVRMRGGSAILSVGDVFFKEDHAYFASEAFFSVFSIRLLEGEMDEVLKRPYTLVLSATTAKKYFGDENPLGKTMKFNGRNDFEVTGVFEDFPENSHMKPDVLYSFETMIKWAGEEIRTAWQWDGFYNYILLKQGTDPKVFESKLPAFVDKQAGEQLKKFDAGMAFHLQPIFNIHLDSDYIGEFEANGDRMSVEFLTVIAAFILFIAWINYINLSTAKSVERAKEVGLRKAMGGYRSQLVRQFLFESTLLNIVAFAVAILMVFLVLPYFNELAGRNIGFSLLVKRDFWIVLVLVIGTGIVLSGLYPAFVLSGYKPVDVLKGKFSTSWRGLYLRKTLVIFQFVATVILLVGTFTVYRQISFMRDQKLGVDIDQTLVLRGPASTDSTYVTRYDVFRNSLLTNSEIKTVTASTAIPGMQPWWNAGGIRLISQGEEDSKQYRVIGSDYDFVDAFNLALVAGRKFSREFPNERKSVLFNESGIKVLGFENPEEVLDKEIFFWGDTFRIVGVLKDYHQESLKKAYDPLIFRFIPDASQFYSIKLNAASVHETIDMVKDKWSATFPGNPFDYFFLDDHYNKQYQADLQFGTIAGLFSGLAILIACLGLFGLSSLTAVQRTKEIGVRKVLGASITSIVLLMGKNFFLLVVIAIVAASPVAWFVMNQWLEGFANRINMSWWLFAIPGFTVIMIAMTTIGFHTIRTARVNPSHSLRYE